jgi:tellurite resistance protein TehA-like permease
MATGIVAVATHLHGVPWAPTVLFWLNAFFFAGLVAATGARILRYPGAFAADVRSHSRGVGFFTIAAAAGVFGNSCFRWKPWAWPCFSGLSPECSGSW